MKIEDDALLRLFDLAGDVPYNVQALAHEVWNLGKGVS
jgi:hypothetical protein